MDKSLDKIRSDIKIILENFSDEKALLKLNGYLEQYYWDSQICYEIAHLNIKTGNLVQAGKLLYFKDLKTTIEENAVTIFETRYGNDKSLILRELIGHYFKSPKPFSKKVKLKYLKFINSVKDEKGEVPRFVLNWYNHFISLDI